MERAIRLDCFQNLANYKKPSSFLVVGDIPAAALFYGAWHDSYSLWIYGVSSDAA